MIHLKVPADFLHLLLENCIRLERGVEANGALILAGGLIEVEVNAGIVDLFLDHVPFGEVEQVLRRNGKKKVNIFFSLLLIVQHESAHLKPTHFLENVDHGIKLNRK